GEWYHSPVNKIRILTKCGLKTHKEKMKVHINMDLTRVSLSLSNLNRKSDTRSRVSFSLSDLKRKSDTRSRVSLSLSDLKHKSDTRSRVSLSLSDLALKQDAIPGFSHSL